MMNIFSFFFLFLCTQLQPLEASDALSLVGRSWQIQYESPNKVEGMRLHPNAPDNKIDLQNITYEHPRKRKGEKINNIPIDLPQEKYATADKILGNFFRTFFDCEANGEMEKGKIVCKGKYSAAMKAAVVIGPDGKKITQAQGMEAIILNEYIRPVFNRVLRENFHIKKYACSDLPHPNDTCTIEYKQIPREENQDSNKHAIQGS